MYILHIKEGMWSLHRNPLFFFGEQDKVLFFVAIHTLPTMLTIFNIGGQKKNKIIHIFAKGCGVYAFFSSLGITFNTIAI